MDGFQPSLIIDMDTHFEVADSISTNRTRIFMVPLKTILLSGTFFLLAINAAFGQYTPIPSTPYEAKLWLKNSSNSYETNDVGEVVKVNIEYVPRVFVLGDLAVFPKLEWVRINYSGRFYDRHMSGTARLKNLKHLTIRRCDEVTEAALSVLRYLPKLEQVDLIDVESTYSVRPLAHCRSLKRLDLSNNSHFDFKNLRGLSGLDLEELNLANNSSLEDKHLVHLANFPNLKKLSLSLCTELTDEGLACVANLGSLRSLDITGCKSITGTFLKEVNRNLESLVANRCKFNDDGMKNLARLSALKELGVSGNEDITEEGLFSIASCDNLEKLTAGGLALSLKHFEAMKEFRFTSLSLAGCSQVTGECVAATDCSQTLEYLDLSKCRRINSPDLRSIAGCKKLATLRLSNTRVDWEGIGFLSGLKELKEIYLNECKWIDDAAMEQLTSIDSIELVEAKKSLRLSDDAIRHLAKLPNLRKLYLQENNKITGVGFEAFNESNPLERLQMEKLNRLVPEGLRHLKRLQKLTSGLTKKVDILNRSLKLITAKHIHFFFCKIEWNKKF